MSGRPATPAVPALGGLGLGRLRARRAVLLILGAPVAAVLLVLAATVLSASALELALRPRVVQRAAAHTGALLVRPARPPRPPGGSSTP